MLKKGGPRIISKIITGDETYVRFFEQKTPNELKQWVFKGEEKQPQIKMGRSEKKILFAVFFRSNCLVKAVKLEGQKTVTANWYITVCLPKIFDELSIKGTIFHHDNAPSDTALATKQFLKEKKVKLMEHPPYSPDLAPCDFFLFPKLKKKLRGQVFKDENKIEKEIMKFFNGLKKTDWYSAFNMWKQRMQKCIDNGGDYFENK